MEVVCADPKAGPKEASTRDQAGGSPSDDSRFPVCPMNIQYDLTGSQARILDIALQLATKFRRGLPHLLGEQFPGTCLGSLHRLGEFGDPGMHFFRELARDLLQHEFVQRHQRERGVPRFDSNAIARRNFAYQPFHIQHGTRSDQLKPVDLFIQVPLDHSQALLGHDREGAVLNGFREC